MREHPRRNYLGLTVKRTACAAAYFTEEEYRRICLAARLMKVSISQFLRNAAMEAAKRVQP